MNANDFTFGIEIECYIPIGTPWSVGGYHRGIQIPNFPAGWNAQQDGSLLNNGPAGYRGVEVVSPILRGEDGIRQVIEVAGKMNEINAKVNGNCGFHVHVGWNVREMKRMEYLVFLTANLEGALYAATGTKNRERGSYCRSIKQSHRELNFKAARVDGIGSVPRMASLNLTNITGGSKPTIEFRAFSGTTNAKKMVAWVRMCVAIVDKSLKMKRRASWDCNRSMGREAAPAMNGREQMERFFHQVGWTIGNCDEAYGVVAPDQMTVDTTKRILLEMATKYDAQP